ncbi:MAG: MFS transporter [Oscillospiraceae bacterium]|nr:MFS transporter [Oscillospiraceae bacterium]
MKKRSPYVPVIAALIVQVCVGIIYAWSALRKSAIDFYGWEPKAATLVASYMLFAFVIGNFVGGALNDRIGPKKSCFVGVALFGLGILLSSFLPAGGNIAFFYLTFGVIGGFGSGVAYGANLACIQMWLPHRRGLATGLAAAFFGFSTFVFSFAVKALLAANIAINTLLLIFAIAFLAIGLIASLFVRLPDEEYLAALPKPAAKKNALVAKESKTLGQAIKTVPFWCLVACVFFYNGTWNMLNPIIRDLGMDERGLSDGVATLLLSLTGLANACGRLIMSALSDKLGRIPTIFLLSGMTAACALLLMFVPGYGYFIVVLLTAFAFGGPAAINPATSTDFFGPKYAGTNYGVIMLSLGLSSLFFNFLSGSFPAENRYFLTFLIGAITALINIGNYLFLRAYMKKHALD